MLGHCWELTSVLRVCPVSGLFSVGDCPSDVADELFVKWIIGETVSEVHCDVGEHRRQRELRSHAAVRKSLLGAGVVLDDVPMTQKLRKGTLRLAFGIGNYYYCICN